MHVILEVSVFELKIQHHYSVVSLTHFKQVIHGITFSAREMYAGIANGRLLTVVPYIYTNRMCVLFH